MSEPDETLLSRLRDELECDSEPPASAIAAIRAEAEARRDRKELDGGTPRVARRDFLLGGLGAAAGAALGVGATVIADDDPRLPPTEAIALSGPLSGEAVAELINHTWGVELLLTVSGLPEGRRYDVVYIASDGRPVDAGSFIGVGASQLCRMTAALLRDATRAIEVRDETGAVMISSTLS